jgi:hypothetical protein
LRAQELLGDGRIEKANKAGVRKSSPKSKPLRCGDPQCGGVIHLRQRAKKDAESPLKVGR